MLPKILAAVAVAAITATALVSPADAAKRRHYGHYRHYGYYGYYGSSPPSLDGVVTGRPRTCGFATYQYDNRGVPVGPYCH
jgi:hypothetical protein